MSNRSSVQYVCARHCPLPTWSSRTLPPLKLPLLGDVASPYSAPAEDTAYHVTLFPYPLMMPHCLGLVMPPAKRMSDTRPLHRLGSWWN